MNAEQILFLKELAKKSGWFYYEFYQDVYIATDIKVEGDQPYYLILQFWKNNYNKLKVVWDYSKAPLRTEFCIPLRDHKKAFGNNKVPTSWNFCPGADIDDLILKIKEYWRVINDKRILVLKKRNQEQKKQNIENEDFIVKMSDLASRYNIKMEANQFKINAWKIGDITIEPSGNKWKVDGDELARLYFLNNLDEVYTLCEWYLKRPF